jgi:hypothetical protein
MLMMQMPSAKTSRQMQAPGECQKQENAMSSWHDMMHILGVVGC